MDLTELTERKTIILKGAIYRLHWETWSVQKDRDARARELRKEGCLYVNSCKRPSIRPDRFIVEYVRKDDKPLTYL